MQHGATIEIEDFISPSSGVEVEAPAPGNPEKGRLGPGGLYQGSADQKDLGGAVGPKGLAVW